MTSTGIPNEAQGADREGLRGIAAMTGAMCCFIFSDMFAKLASAVVPVGEVIAVRGLVSTLFMAIPVLMQGTLPLLFSKFSRAWAVRVLGEVAAALTFIPALANMPIANVVSITQTVPLALTAAGALFFGEIVGWRRWAATVIGFLGVLLIVRPGSEAFSWWSIAALGCVVSVVVRDIATRRMVPGVPATLLTASTAFGVMLAGCCLSLFGGPWLWPSVWTAFCLAASGVAVAGGYYLSILAIRFAALSTVAPFRYTIIPMSLIAGYVIWGDRPDPLSLSGIAVIVSAGIYTFWREHRAVVRR
jgi:drug/metabolite transporter (DMT)-like permease